MDKYVDEIKEFIAHKHRFNVILIKDDQKIDLDELSKKLNYQIIDATEKVTEFEKIGGYTDLLKFFRNISDETTKEGVLVVNNDFFLSLLNKKKIEQFFENVLQKTFPKPIILTTVIFKDEVPDIRQEEFNYAKIIDGGEQS
jgi:hypothetical protein